MRYRDHLPQLDGGLFLTDAGLETELVFHDGLDLPLFAAFDVLKDEAGTDRLRRYYHQFAALARDRGVGLVLESPTWRASPRWAREIGYSDARARRAQPQGDRSHGGGARGVRVARHALRDLRATRPAGRRLQPRGDADGRRGAELPRDADRHLRRHRGGHGHGADDDLRRRGGGHRTGRGRGRAAGGHLLHRGDRRPPAERPGAGRGHRRGRRGHGRGTGLLHDQLRPSDPLRRCHRRRRAVGRARPRPARQRLDDAATPSSTRPPSWTRATRSTSVRATSTYGTSSRSSPSWAAAAARTFATSSGSPRPGCPGSPPRRRRPRPAGRSGPRPRRRGARGRGTPRCSPDCRRCAARRPEGRTSWPPPRSAP